MEKPGDNASTLNLDEEKYVAAESDEAGGRERRKEGKRGKDRRGEETKGKRKHGGFVCPSVHPARLCFVKFKELLARGW